MDALTRWLASIWVNAGRAVLSVTNDRIDAIVKLANAQYVPRSNAASISSHALFPSDRIAKETAKVIDASDAVLVSFSMHVSINAFEKINISHVR